jgi:hypothetical protein
MKNSLLFWNTDRFVAEYLAGFSRVIGVSPAS